MARRKPRAKKAPRPGRATRQRGHAAPSKKRAPRATRSIALAEAQIRWLDSLAESIAVNGGPRFTRTEILQALIDASTGRSIDPHAIRDLEDLRVAFGAPDFSKVEQLLKERPKLEPGVLDALKDTIK